MTIDGMMASGGVTLFCLSPGAHKKGRRQGPTVLSLDPRMNLWEQSMIIAQDSAAVCEWMLKMGCLLSKQAFARVRLHHDI